MSSNFLTMEEVISIDDDLIAQLGGSLGLRDMGALESALLSNRWATMTDCLEEAAALMESLANNHPSVDGNKRVAIAGFEMPLEISAPDVVGAIGLVEGLAPSWGPPQLSSRLNQPVAGQDASGGAGRRPLLFRLLLPKPGHQLLGPPGGIGPPGGHQPGLYLGRCLPGMGMSSPAPVAQALKALLFKPLEPLVAGLPADAKGAAELGDTLLAAQIPPDELLLLHSRFGLGPRQHCPPSPHLLSSIGKCYPCSRFVCYQSSRFVPPDTPPLPPPMTPPYHNIGQQSKPCLIYKLATEAHGSLWH